MIREISTKTTPREEWSYIALVLKELLSMGCEKLFHKDVEKAVEKRLKKNG
jgi:hypothetical protein